MIVTKSIGQVSYKMEGTPQEIAEYEQLQERNHLIFKTEIHIIPNAKINKEELAKALNDTATKTFGSF